jgi:dTDP-4-amino-4,6-dideoxygalactose transaminase
MSYWKKAVKHPLPGTEVWKELLSLPVHHHLTDEEQDYVIAQVFNFYETAVR